MSTSRESSGEPPSYMVAGDRRSLELIFSHLEYASFGLTNGDYDNAMENLEAAWERLPNKIKDQFQSPTLTLRDRVGRIQTVEELYNDLTFQQQYGSRYKAEEKYRDRMKNALIYEIVHECTNKYIQSLDESGLYVREAGGGIGVFPKYDEVEKSMTFKVKKNV